MATYNHIINQCLSTNHTIHCTILKQLTVCTNFTFREINYPQASRVAANHLYDVNIFKPLFYSSVNSKVFLIIYFDASDKFKHLILVGQCGNQIGSAFWPLLLEEYGILSSSTNSSLNASFKLDKSFNSFFNCPEGASKLGSLMDLTKSKVTARVSFLHNEMKNGFF